MQTFLRDLRYAGRILAQSPAFTTVAVVTLALGIGANSAIFSLVNTVLLRPLPYPESGRLVWLSERSLNWEQGSISYPNFADWKAQQSVFDHFGVYNWNNFTFTGRGDPVQLTGAQISADAFAALQSAPALGRVFNEDEDRPGAAPVVVLSHALWQSRFGGDPRVVGEKITLDGRASTVVGVMGPGFAFPNDVSLWVPVGPLAADPGWQNRGNHPGLLGIARLKPGVTLAQARAALDTIAVRLEEQYPESNKNRRVRIDPLLDNQVRRVRWALWTLMGAVGLVLLIACANVANLLLARAAARQKEMALRAALGAGRWRICRQLLTESVLLAAVGAGSGLLLAHWGLRLIVPLSAGALPRASEVNLDARVLLFSIGLAALTGILFGLAPAWHSIRLNLQPTLQESSRSSTGGRGRLRQGLVITEVALTLLLLAGAGLLLKSFYHLQQVNPGFGFERVLSFRINLPERKYPGLEPPVRFYETLLANLRALPGVEAASLASQIPLDGNSWDTGFLIEGRPEPPPHEWPLLEVHLVGDDYFRAMGIPVLQGRAFQTEDNREHLRDTGRDQGWGAGLKTMIVDEEFARRHWPNENPIGQRVRIPWGPREEQPILTVVGVVGRVREERITEAGGKVQAYFPFRQLPTRGAALVVKTTADPGSLIASIRQQVLARDPDQPIYDVRTLAELRRTSLAPERLNLTLLGAFAAVALALAVVGLYGLLAYSVAQRHREIGIRLALGAQRRDVLHLVVGEGMRLAVVGAGFGLLGAAGLTRLLRRLLFEVEPSDPLTFLAVTLALAGAALLACWLPARHATTIDPMTALKYE